MSVLNEGQSRIANECVHWYKYGSEQVFQYSGGPGTGKSHLAYVIFQMLGLQPYQVLPMAYTGQAAIVMRTKGFTNARSIHSSLYETVEYFDHNDINSKFGRPVKKRTFKLTEYIDPRIELFFIDEGFMVPDIMVKDILSFGKKVIVCGDADQLPPVVGNPGFLTGPGIHRLTEIMRQNANNPIIYLADRAIKGLPIHSGIYGNNVLVIDDTDFNPAMIRFADCIACGTNRTRDQLNNYIRQVAGFDRSPIPIYGERIICRNNNWNLVKDGIALTNGLCGTVTSFPDAMSFNGKSITLDFLPDLCNTVFDNINIDYNYFVAPYDEKARIKESMKWSNGELFEFAYALTTHLCQGGEYRKGIYIEEFMRPQIQNQLNYTGITRFKDALIYVKKKCRNFYILDLNQIFNQ